MSDAPPITTQPVKTERERNEQDNNENTRDEQDENEKERAKKNKTFWQRYCAPFHHCCEDLADCLEFWCCKNECFNFCCNYNDIDDDDEEDAGEVAFNSDGGEQAVLTVINRRGSHHEGVTENKGYETLENNQGSYITNPHQEQSGNQSGRPKGEDHQITEDEYHSVGHRDHSGGHHDHTAGQKDHSGGHHDHSAGHHDHSAGHHDHSGGHQDNSAGDHYHSSGGHYDGGHGGDFGGGDCGGGDSGGGGGGDD